MTIEKYLASQQEYIEQRLTAYLEEYAANSPVYDAMCYSVLGGGKRIRPILVYTVGASYGIKASTLDAAACALELIHCYSLIHDDLPAMDDDDVRRGKPSCHKKFDEATAILAGDALQTLAFEIIAKPNKELSSEIQLKMVQILASASGCNGIVGGQVRDMQASKKTTSYRELDIIHKEKTASLFNAAIELGSISYPASKTNDLGNILGMAFQLQDDLLETTGIYTDKPLDSDIKNDKPTHHQILGIKAAEKLLTEYYNKAKEIISVELPTPTKMLQILEIMAGRKS